MILLCHFCEEPIEGEPEFTNSNYGKNHPCHDTCLNFSNKVQAVVRISEDYLTDRIISKPSNLFLYCAN